MMNKHAICATLVVLLASASSTTHAKDPATSLTARPTSAGNLELQQPATMERAESEIREMETLFSGSTAAKQVGDSQSGAVSNGIHDAEKIRLQAHQAMEEKNYAKAIQLSKEAKSSFFDTARHAEPDQALAHKHESDFNQRLESVRALSKALVQVCEDSGKQSDAAMKNIHWLVNQANDLAMAHKYVEGRKSLDKAFMLLKVSIETIKNGTMVTAPKDTSPKGLYEYEIFRNDTYQTLIAMIIDENRKLSIAVDANFLADVKKGDGVYKDGIALGKKARYEEATKKLLESTSIYKRAIRLAGIRIPS